MSMHALGETRSRRTANHLLQTPDTFVWAPLPGMVNAAACVHASSALGAAFTMYTAVLEAGGALGRTPHSRFLYTLEGSAEMAGDAPLDSLHTGGFAYLPPGSGSAVSSASGARLLVIEKPYLALDGSHPPATSGTESAIAPAALMGNEALQVRALLPADGRFDFAVNTMEYQPGAALPQVEVHVMEHGLLMLAGGGIYRLGDAWYPVQAGDFIWMGAFCPQWFGALGKQPARYLIYKDWNRHPLHRMDGAQP